VAEPPDLTKQLRMVIDGKLPEQQSVDGQAFATIWEKRA
jgi:hypothetical protein